ncbi:hypothetical protein PInf_005680 [Phytophthora infestans]|nr:hypothetical protein PInf_005680 [Phytophthora infestans]
MLLLRRIGLRPVQAVDYVRAVQGRAKDYSIDEDCKEEEERANGGDAGAVDVVVNADDVDAVDNTMQTQKPWNTTTQTQRPWTTMRNTEAVEDDDADTETVKADDNRLLGDSDDDVDDRIGDDRAATGSDNRLRADAAVDVSTGPYKSSYARLEATQRLKLLRNAILRQMHRKEKKRKDVMLQTTTLPEGMHHYANVPSNRR